MLVLGHGNRMLRYPGRSGSNGNDEVLFEVIVQAIIYVQESELDVMLMIGIRMAQTGPRTTEWHRTAPGAQNCLE